MNRRQVLVAGGLAAVSAVSFAKETAISTITRGGTPPVRPLAPTCALLPIEFDHRVAGAPISQLQVLKYWASESTTALTRWDFDLQIFDQFNLPQWVYAWQLRRSTSGLAMPSNGVKMRFPIGARMDMTATVKLASGSTSVFNASVPNGWLMVLATARQRAGRPPQMSELRFDPSKYQLMMADGSPRDFDALLLRTN